MSDDKKNKRAAEDDGKDEKKGKKAKTGEKKEKGKKGKKEKKEPETFQLNVNKAVDKKHEGKSFAEIIKLPPSALEGLAATADPVFAEYGMKTIESMAQWKYFQLATAILELSKTEEKGKREEGAKLNISKAVDKKYEKMALKDIAKAPLSAFKGLTDAANDHFVTGQGKIETITDLAKWKFFKYAQALVTLAAYESEAATASS